MPIILATWEAEIGRIVVPGQPRQIIWKTLSPKQPRVKWTGGCGSSGRVSALPSVKSWVQTPVSLPPTHKKIFLFLGMVVHICNPSTWVGGSQVQGQCGLHRETLPQNKQANKSPPTKKSF
jgi:hypothetical protein